MSVLKCSRGTENYSFDCFSLVYNFLGGIRIKELDT